MLKHRVMIVDDSVVIRRAVAEELATDPALEIVAAASNGRLALEKMTQVNPDLVILDVEMPELDGLATLTELRKLYPTMPVIMFSALTERGASATIDALMLGATDYFTKPAGPGGLEESRRVIREELAPAIKAICGKSKSPNALARPTNAQQPTPPIKRTTPHGMVAIEVVAIGVSTGGPNALGAVFDQIPRSFSVPVLIVQHMPPMFTRMLAQQLSARGGLPVAEAVTGQWLQPGQCLVAPGDHHMIVVRDGARVRVLLHQDPPENSCRPAVDPLFRSVAKVFGDAALAVVLTGMGQDGLRGCEHIKEAGGQVLAQDEHSSVVWGMPGFVARAGLADKVLPLSLIGGEIVRRVTGQRT